MNVEWCHRSGKVKHASKRAAQKTIGAMKDRRKTYGQLSVYRCPFCELYHTTKLTHYRPTYPK